MMSYLAFSYGRGNWQAMGTEHIFFKIPFGKRGVKKSKSQTKILSVHIKNGKLIISM